VFLFGPYYHFNRHIDLFWSNADELLYLDSPTLLTHGVYSIFHSSSSSLDSAMENSNVYKGFFHFFMYSLDRNTYFYLLTLNFHKMAIKNIEIVKTEILSDNWYTLKKLTYQYTKPDGTIQQQSREAYDRGNGAAILLYNITSQTVILTRQFRIPTYINGNESGMLIEACAGLLDQDSPQDCIRRETEEETGYQIKEAKKIFEAYMSPGSVTEILHFFIAEYTNNMKVSDGGGLEEEEEHIEILEINIQDALQMIDTGEIKDGKTIMLLQYIRLKNIM
jgi:nudix-type nucleoside diphosphatase (YffH/AdpP family)